jgi:hypothetical protein
MFGMVETFAYPSNEKVQYLGVGFGLRGLHLSGSKCVTESLLFGVKVT